jgi:hypothetical protein
MTTPLCGKTGNLKLLLKRMNKTLYDYNNIHDGETIYLLGNSPSLLRLSEEDRSILKEKVTIGLSIAFEGVERCTYTLSAHIAPAVYAFEYGPPDMPLFTAYYGDREKPFEYMQDLFWNNSRIVKFRSSPTGPPFYKKESPEDTSIVGWSSLALLATHLAYIMGAAKIVYIGFDELSWAHFWNYDKGMEARILKNIRNILDSKKYWSDQFYNNNPSTIPYNVHKEFEQWIGEVPGCSNQFMASEHLINKPFGFNIADGGLMRQRQVDFERYIKYLTALEVKTYTLSTEGITIAGGCTPIPSIQTMQFDLSRVKAPVSAII